MIREQLAEAAAARKCHGCGCLHETVAALEGTDVGGEALAAALADTRKVFRPKEYDCLGCQVCYPAIATNAFTESFPEDSARLDPCPTDVPAERRGWPPLPGDYAVIRYGAPIAICALNSAWLPPRLAEHGPAWLSITGTLHTENLGIERIIRNVLSNPHIRFLLLCGEDTRQVVGHLPGQSLVSLFHFGMDDGGRIRKAGGKRPILKNVSAAQVKAFLEQVELVELTGCEDVPRILDAAAECASRDPGPFQGAPDEAGVGTVEAKEPQRLISDPAGFFVVYSDGSRRRLIVEHYSTSGVLDCVITGDSSAAISAEVIERGLISRLDHATYLGRELARAELSLKTGEPYIQDRAPGEPSPTEKPLESCGCGPVCEPEGQT